MMRLVKLLLLLPLLLSMGSCSGGSDPEPDPWADAGDMEVNLCLQVSVSDAAGTGATTTRNFTNEDGQEVVTENPMWVYEKINTLRVIIVRPDNTVEHNFMEALPSLEAVEHFKELLFKVSTTQGTPDATNPNIRIERKRIYLIANEAAIEPKEIRDRISHFIPGDKIEPSGSNGSGAPLWLLDNNWPSSGNAVPLVDNENPADGRKKFIPMTEFFDVDVKFDITKGATHRIQTEKMFITRALVKFQFEIQTDPKDIYSDNIKIKKIEFGNLSQKEYLFPCETTYFPPKSDREAPEREITSFKTPGLADNLSRKYEFNPSNFGRPCNHTTSSNLLTVYNPAIYFCESQTYNGTASSEEIYTINVTAEFIGPDGNSMEITFDRKNLPNLKALPRNTIVKIRLIFTPHDMNCEVVLFPYTAVTLNPEFGFAPPESMFLTIPPTLTLSVGQSAELSATLTPPLSSEKEIEEFRPLIWVSSNREIISFSEVETPEDREPFTDVSSLELLLNKKIKVTAKRRPTEEEKKQGVIISVYSQNGLTAFCKVNVE